MYIQCTCTYVGSLEYMYVGSLEYMYVGSLEYMYVGPLEYMYVGPLDYMYVHWFCCSGVVALWSCVWLCCF